MKKTIGWHTALSALVITFPLFLLLFRWRGGFTSDWYNSLWMIAYQGQYFAQHLDFSPVLNTPDTVGIMFPVFYGYLFYPILGLVSSVVGPHIAIRIAAFIILGLQFFLVKKLTLKITQDSAKSWVTSVLMSWSIYPLTNLYSRSAFPEFFATTALICAFCLWFLLLLEPSNQKKIDTGIGFALIILLMASAHTITAFYGISALALTVILTGFFHLKENPQQKKPIFLVLISSAILLVLSLSPWLYVLKLFHDKLQISGSLSELTYYEGIDKRWIRLFPLPLDYRSVISGITTPTSGLETQINFSLLLLLFGTLIVTIKQTGWKILLMSKQGIASGFCLFLSFSIFNVSINHHHGAILAKFLAKAQIAYRLVTYVNLSLFLSLIALWFLPKARENRGSPPTNHIFSTVLITLSMCGILIKLLHASLLLPEWNRFGYSQFFNYKEDAAQVPKSFYSLDNYAVMEGLTPLTPEELAKGFEVKIPIVGSEKFGETKTANFDLKKDTWILTNVYPFPWNRISLNGILISPQEVRLAHGRLAFRILASGNYKLDYHFKPDKIWGILNRVSFASLFLSLFLSFIYGIHRWLNIKTRSHQSQVLESC